MNAEEFYAELNKLKENYEQQTRALCSQYAREHNNVEIGDIVSDGKEIISVQKFVLCRPTSKPPYYAFKGIQLTKKMEPYKNRSVTTIWDVKYRIRKQDVKPEILASIEKISKEQQEILQKLQHFYDKQ